MAALPPRAPRKPIFTGADYDCPLRFLEEFQQYAEVLGIVGDRDRAAELVSCLEGKARELTTRFPVHALSTAEITEELKMMFGSPTVIRDLRIRLDTDNQGRGEGVREYIMRKYLLCRRLYPYASEEEQVHRILFVLQPEMAGLIRSHRPRTMSELRTLATEMEAVLRGLRSSLAPRPTPRPQPRQQPPPRSQVQQLPQCRFCPDQHWHRDCPVLRTTGPQGNQ